MKHFSALLLSSALAAQTHFSDSFDSLANWTVSTTPSPSAIRLEGFRTDGVTTSSALILQPGPGQSLGLELQTQMLPVGPRIWVEFDYALRLGTGAVPRVSVWYSSRIATLTADVAPPGTVIRGHASYELLQGGLTPNYIRVILTLGDVADPAAFAALDNLRVFSPAEPRGMPWATGFSPGRPYSVLFRGIVSMGTPAFTFVGVSFPTSARLTIPGFEGALGLDPATTVLHGFTMAQGALTANGQVPANPLLVGLGLTFQAVQLANPSYLLMVPYLTEPLTVRIDGGTL